MEEEKRISEEELKKDVAAAEARIRKTDDFTSPEELYGELIASVKKYHPSDDISLIEKAYRVAADAHKDQKRKSGEPYIIHPLCVAIILADLELDKESIAAGLLHDVVEDTVMTEEELTEEFGPEVSLIVSGVTKLAQLKYSADKVEEQAENLRKMFLAMAKDIRVILVKLADRLHNMRTAQYWSPETQKKKARETMDIYAPIAQRLGISKIKVELDDLSLKYLEPDAYYELVQKVSMKREQRQEFVDAIVKEVTRPALRQMSTDESSTFSASTKRWSTSTRRWIRSMTSLRSALSWNPSKTAMQRSVLSMKCTRRSRAVSKITLRCRSQTVTSPCIQP